MKAGVIVSNPGEDAVFIDEMCMEIKVDSSLSLGMWKGWEALDRVALCLRPKGIKWSIGLTVLSTVE